VLFIPIIATMSDAQTSTAYNNQHIVFIAPGSGWSADMPDKQILNLTALIQDQLLRADIDVVMGQLGLTSCQQGLCGQNSSEALIQMVRESMGNVSLVILYSIDSSSGVLMQAFDPLNRKLTFSVELPFIGSQQSISDAQIRRSLLDASYLLIKQIKSQKRVFNVAFSLSGFSQSQLSMLFDIFKSLDVKPSDVRLTRSELDVASPSLFSHWQTNTATFSVATSATATQVWQMLQQAKQQKDVNMNIAFNEDPLEFNLQGIGDPFAIQKLMVAAASLLVIYLLISFTIFLIYSRRLAVYAQHRRMTDWAMLYQKWKQLPVYVPKKLSHFAVEVQQDIKLASELIVVSQDMLNQDDKSAALAHLERAKAIDIAHTKILPLDDLLNASSQNKYLETERLADLKQHVQKSVSCLHQAQFPQAYYYAYSAQQLCNIDEYQERAAIKKLLQKIDSAAIANINNLTLTITNTEVETEQICHGRRVTTCISSASHCLIGRPLMPQTPDDSNGLSIPINHPSASRIGRQCKIEVTQQQFFLCDQNSSNGTWLNNKKISPKLAQALKTQDTIALANQDDLSPLIFVCKLDEQQQSLMISLDPKISEFHDIPILQNTWHDLPHILNRQWWLVGQGLYLCAKSGDEENQKTLEKNLQTAKNGLYWANLNEIETTAQVLGVLEFGLGWYFSPDKGLIKSRALCLDETIMLGKVRLREHNQISFDGMHMTLKLTTVNIDNKRAEMTTSSPTNTNAASENNNE